MKDYFSVIWEVDKQLTPKIARVFRQKGGEEGYYVEDRLIKSVLVFQRPQVWIVYDCVKSGNVIRSNSNGLERSYEESSTIYQEISAAIIHDAITEE